jgi:hypothetical protein
VRRFWEKNAIFEAYSIDQGFDFNQWKFFHSPCSDWVGREYCDYLYLPQGILILPWCILFPTCTGYVMHSHFWFHKWIVVFIHDIIKSNSPFFVCQLITTDSTGDD